MSSHKIKAPYKRWFPVSHEINRDPDMRGMIRECGPASFRVWLELLHIGDLNEGYIPGRLRDLAPIIASSCQTTTALVVRCVGYMSQKRRIVYHNGGGLDRSRYLASWAKYHRTREPVGGGDGRPIVGGGSPDGRPIVGGGSGGSFHLSARNITGLKNELAVSEPSEPSEPSLKESTLTSETLSVSDFCDSWNEYFEGKLPRINLPLAASRQRKLKLRLRDHPELVFWQGVFKAIYTSDFLMGRNGNDWRASFDWLIDNDKNCLKVAEGNYVNKDSAGVR